MKYLNFYAQIYSAWERCLDNLKYFFKKINHLIHLGLIVVFQILLWWQAFNIYHRINGRFLILHYNVDFGIDLLASAKNIFYLPLSVLILNLINLILAIIFFRRESHKSLSLLLLNANALILLFSNLAIFILFLINFH